MSSLTHFDEAGGARMVNVGEKLITARRARASGRIGMKPETVRLIRDRRAAKGDVLQVARLAGLMAAKRTAELIPLCHPIALDTVEIRFEFPNDREMIVEAEARAEARTGVEMEALTAVAAAALTVYDMCKAVDRAMTIESVRLEEKSGGRSGHFVRMQSMRSEK